MLVPPWRGRISIGLARTCRKARRRRDIHPLRRSLALPRMRERAHAGIRKTPQRGSGRRDTQGNAAHPHRLLDGRAPRAACPAGGRAVGCGGHHFRKPRDPGPRRSRCKARFRHSLGHPGADSCVAGFHRKMECPAHSRRRDEGQPRGLEADPAPPRNRT